VLTTSKTDDELQNVLHYENIITSRLSRDIASGSITFFWSGLIYLFTNTLKILLQFTNSMISRCLNSTWMICAFAFCHSWMTWSPQN